MNELLMQLQIDHFYMLTQHASAICCQQFHPKPARVSACGNICSNNGEAYGDIWVGMYFSEFKLRASQLARTSARSQCSYPLFSSYQKLAV
ncbi:MAG: hypothetical protein HC780_04095 [Leptolyngbyaceae cyanobacterium CSU_1_3]|nr:hypothetical protein [Leptolyngbyaceae cyanobacterium CSU_1_3]